MADNSNPKVLNDTGDAYFYGIGRPVNRELAYTYYKQAADLDNPVGYFNLGQYFAAKGDDKAALLNYEKAKAFLHAPAFLALARRYEKGVGVRKNKAKAFKMYLGAAKLSDIEAFDAVGLCYRNGNGTKKDAGKAKEWFRKAADQNDALGCCQLGLILMSESAFRKSPDEAVGWLDKGATGGSVDAMRTLEEYYLAGKHPALRKKSRTHLDEMVFYYRELLAKAGDLPSLRTIAAAYHDGTSVCKIDYDKSAAYYRALCDRDDPVGKYGYGVSLLYGQGVKTDAEQARRLLQDAARERHPLAMTRLGDADRLGLGGPVDFESAKKWYMEAARLQEPEATMNLGLLNYRGQVEGASPQLAFNHMETAAKNGSVQAHYWLGIFHDKGIGCDRDFDEAEKSFRRAIAGGSLGAKYKYASMIFEELPGRQKNAKKAEPQWAECRRLFVEYLEDPAHNAANGAFARYELGLIHRDGMGTPAAPRRARYWFEAAAEDGLTRAMTELYRLLRERDFPLAKEWLDRAAADATNADALYEKGLLLLEGGFGVQVDPKAGRALLDAAARLNHREAIAKLLLL
ncbi:MAG: SEL1-like repeat protein [Candidatus Izemoplasmatales bacterium]